MWFSYGPWHIFMWEKVWPWTDFIHSRYRLMKGFIMWERLDEMIHGWCMGGNNIIRSSQLLNSWIMEVDVQNHGGSQHMRMNGWVDWWLWYGWRYDGRTQLVIEHALQQFNSKSLNSWLFYHAPAPGTPIYIYIYISVFAYCLLPCIDRGPAYGGHSSLGQGHGSGLARQGNRQ